MLRLQQKATTFLNIFTTGRLSSHKTENNVVLHLGLLAFPESQRREERTNKKREQFWNVLLSLNIELSCMMILDKINSLVVNSGQIFSSRLENNCFSTSLLKLIGFVVRSNCLNNSPVTYLAVKLRNS